MTDPATLIRYFAAQREFPELSPLVFIYRLLVILSVFGKMSGKYVKSRRVFGTKSGSRRRHLSLARSMISKHPKNRVESDEAAELQAPSTTGAMATEPSVDVSHWHCFILVYGIYDLLFSMTKNIVVMLSYPITPSQVLDIMYFFID